MKKYTIIDADGHITETEAKIREYISSPHNKRTPLFSMGTETWDRALHGTRRQRGDDSKTWLDTLDQHGLESTVLFPSRGLQFGKYKEAEFAIALCRAYNDFVHHEFLKVSPRLQAVAVVPIQDVGEAIK